MALIKCPACEKDVSTEAASCPNCGHPVASGGDKPQKKSRHLGGVLALLLGLVVIAIILNHANQSRSTSTTAARDDPCQSDRTKCASNEAKSQQPSPSPSIQAVERCNYSAKENIQHFDLAVRTLHLENSTTAAELQKLVVHLCATGLDEREAYRTIDIMLASPTLNPQAYPLIADIAQRLSLLPGHYGLANTALETRRFVETINRGIEPLTDLAISVGALTGNRAASLVEMARHDGVKAIQLTVDALNAHLGR
jgi:hypothetical protein